MVTTSGEVVATSSQLASDINDIKSLLAYVVAILIIILFYFLLRFVYYQFMSLFK